MLCAKPQNFLIAWNFAESVLAGDCFYFVIEVQVYEAFWQT